MVVGADERYQDDHGEVLHCGAGKGYEQHRLVQRRSYLNGLGADFATSPTQPAGRD